MKKIGVISDVHGNLQALQAALAYLHEQNCQEIIHTGDVVDIGANSLECLQLLLQNNVKCVLGNHDIDFINRKSVRDPLSHVSKRHKDHVFAQMERFRETVANFPLFEQRILGGKTVIFEHYCRMDSNDECSQPFKRITMCPSAEIFDEMYSHYNCDAAFFGHKHEPCDVVGKRLYVDVGSVGCHPEPLAQGIVISYDDEHFSYERFSVPYNIDTAKSEMKNVPDGDYLFDFYYLHKKGLPFPD